MYENLGQEDLPDVTKTLYHELEHSKADPKACRKTPAHIVLSINKMLGVVEYKSVWHFIRRLAKNGPGPDRSASEFLAAVVDAGLPIGQGFKLALAVNH